MKIQVNRSTGQIEEVLTAVVKEVNGKGEVVVSGYEKFPNLVVGELDDIEELTLQNIARRVNVAVSLIKDVISKRVIKTISKYNSQLGQMIDYPMYNNVALGKSSGGAFKQFGDEVGSNVWTSETDNFFTSMYDLMPSSSFESNITDVFSRTIGSNQGEVLFDVIGIDLQKAVTGGMVHHSTLVLQGYVTELELQMLMRNRNWFDKVIFQEGGKVLNSEEVLPKRISYLGQ